MKKKYITFVDGWKQRLAERDENVEQILRALIIGVDLGTDKVLSREELLTVARVLYLSDVRYVGEDK